MNDHDDLDELQGLTRTNATDDGTFYSLDTLFRVTASLHGLPAGTTDEDFLAVVMKDRAPCP